MKSKELLFNSYLNNIKDLYKTDNLTYDFVFYSFIEMIDYHNDDCDFKNNILKKYFKYNSIIETKNIKKIQYNYNINNYSNYSFNQDTDNLNSNYSVFFLYQDYEKLQKNLYTLKFLDDSLLIKSIIFTINNIINDNFIKNKNSLNHEKINNNIADSVYAVLSIIDLDVQQSLLLKEYTKKYYDPYYSLKDELIVFSNNLEMLKLNLSFYNFNGNIPDIFNSFVEKHILQINNNNYNYDCNNHNNNNCNNSNNKSKKHKL